MHHGLSSSDPEDCPGERRGGSSPNRAPLITIGGPPGASVDVPSSVFVSVGPQGPMNAASSVFGSVAS